MNTFVDHDAYLRKCSFDGVHNLEGGDYAKILVTAPHNIDYDAEANGMIRVKDWDEILSAVEMLERNAAEA